MWWLLVPTVAVLVSAALALNLRSRLTPVRVDRSVEAPEVDPPAA